MKKLGFLLVMLSGVWLASCQKDGSELTPAEEALNIESVVTASAARYAVSTDSVTVGKCKGKLTEIAATDLLAGTTGYINSTYAGSTIVFAAKDEAGKVVVAIKLADGTLKGLLFNTDGTFKEELKQHPKKAKLTKIEVSELPVTISSYITSNYVAAVVKQAGKNAEGAYFIGILIDKKTKVLLFNADGTFSKELEKPEKGPKGGPKKH